MQRLENTGSVDIFVPGRYGNILNNGFLLSCYNCDVYMS